jgi:hypothetical protein
MKKTNLLVLVLAATVALASAQGFEKGKILVGPTVGYGWGLGFGANIEYGLAEKIGLGADIAYSSFTEKYTAYYSYEWKYTLIGALAAGAYHLMPGKSFDPYLKAGLGYFKWDAKYKDQFGSTTVSSLYPAAYTSGIGYAGQVGARYFFSPSFAGRAAVGWPFYFSAGLDFSF